MVASLTRKARAISGVVSPPTIRRVRATRLSMPAPDGSSEDEAEPVVEHGDSSSAFTASRSRRAGSFRRSVVSRRSRSRTLRCAALVSQAPGLAGIPRSPHVSKAVTKAS